MRPLHRSLAWGFAIGTLVLLTGCTAAADKSTKDAAGDTKAAAPAPIVLTDANIAAILDVASESDSAFGEMAVRKATTTLIREFGQQMMAEHHAFRVQGQQLAAKINVTPAPPAPFELAEEQRLAMIDLETKIGIDFDKAYIDHEIEFHDRFLDTTVVLLRAVQNPELKDLIQKAQPFFLAQVDRAREVWSLLRTSE